ncbi:cell adhesion molecule Dscam1-like [Drosophila takahashii]|uniref:cell adhesion molecule Dscam1-like n=1 Tax=Drosophila takahashii TaxID=29030 RepID=UPI0038992F22
MLLVEEGCKAHYTWIKNLSKWILKPKDQDAVMGDSVMISCAADGFPLPTLQWKKLMGDSGEYRDIGYENTYGNLKAVIRAYLNGTLIISKVDRKHAGSFLCQASNGIGPGLSSLIKLTVHVGPSIRVSKELFTTRRGEGVTIQCVATGDPPLEIYWIAKTYKIDPSVDTHYRIKNSPHDQGVLSELIILQTETSDNGEYLCIAHNDYGNDNGIVQIQVQEPPSFPVNLRIMDLTSRSVTLAWSRNDKDSLQFAFNEQDEKILKYILQYKKAEDSQI